MTDKLVQRKQREADAFSGHSSREVSDEQFFREAGIKVNRGN